MRRLSIPQKPDRPDIDDLRKVTALFDRFHAGLAEKQQPRGFFIPVFERKHIKMESSSPASRTKT